MLTYHGEYHTRDGRTIPYLLGTLEANKLVIKYDVDGERLPTYHVIPIKHNGSVIWRCNAKSISCENAYDMFQLFKRDQAYANATFRHFTGIN